MTAPASLATDHQNHQSAPHASGNSSAHDQHDDHHVAYWKIFIALCFCTIISVALDLIQLPTILLISLVMAVAVAKALFVMAYFMHLKFERGWKYVILAPTSILATGLVIGLIPDIALHYYKLDFPQQQWIEQGPEKVTSESHSSN